MGKLRPVKNLTTGATFASVRSGAASVGVSHGAVRRAIRTRGTAGGSRWAYADHLAPQVRCRETGEVFPSYSAAAAALHLEQSAVRKATRDGRPCCGWTFELIKEVSVAININHPNIPEETALDIAKEAIGHYTRQLQETGQAMKSGAFIATRGAFSYAVQLNWRLTGWTVTISPGELKKP